MADIGGLKVKPRYEYDSDEETDGGTWEHKKRLAEMSATKGKFQVQFVCVFCMLAFMWALILKQTTTQNEPKHFLTGL